MEVRKSIKFYLFVLVPGLMMMGGAGSCRAEISQISGSGGVYSFDVTEPAGYDAKLVLTTDIYDTNPTTASYFLAYAIEPLGSPTVPAGFSQIPVIATVPLFLPYYDHSSTAVISNGSNEFTLFIEFENPDGSLVTEASATNSSPFTPGDLQTIQWSTPVAKSSATVVASESPVPIPSSAFLLGSGLLGFLSFGIRRRSQLS